MLLAPTKDDFAFLNLFIQLGNFANHFLFLLLKLLFLLLNLVLLELDLLLLLLNHFLLLLNHLLLDFGFLLLLLYPHLLLYYLFLFLLGLNYLLLVFEFAFLPGIGQGNRGPWHLLQGSLGLGRRGHALINSDRFCLLHLGDVLEHPFLNPLDLLINFRLLLPHFLLFLLHGLLLFGYFGLFPKLFLQLSVQSFQFRSDCLLGHLGPDFLSLSPRFLDDLSLLLLALNNLFLDPLRGLLDLGLMLQHDFLLLDDHLQLLLNLLLLYLNQLL